MGHYVDLCLYIVEGDQHTTRGIIVCKNNIVNEEQHHTTTGTIVDNHVNSTVEISYKNSDDDSFVMSFEFYQQQEHF